MHWPFEPNKHYSRKADIHGAFRGQPQGGIVTPKDVPGIFAFTGAIGKSLGYSDRFLPDGSFRFTGMGQVGPMTMTVGNKAIREAARNGKDILLFEILGKGKPVRFVNVFACASWEYEVQPDRNGDARQAIVFTLTPVDSVNAVEESALAAGAGSATTVSLTELRAKADDATTSTPQAGTTGGARTIYERSRAVRDYVVARGNGRCEGCNEDAPFLTRAGQPYLEAHHIRRLTDGGPDDFRFMAAVCPNCHRRAHYGNDSKAFNSALLAVVKSIEAKVAA